MTANKLDQDKRYKIESNDGTTRYFDPSKPYIVEEGIQDVSPDTYLKGIAESAVLAGTRGASWGTSDEIFGQAASLWKQARGDERDHSVIAEEMRDYWRNKEKDAYANHPYVSFIAELGGAYASGGTALKGLGFLKKATTLPIPKPGGVLSTLSGAAAYGYGASEEEDVKGQAKDVLLSMAPTSVLSAGGKAIKTVIGRSSEIRAKMMGATKRMFEEDGFLDPEMIANEMKKKKLFSGSDVVFSVDKDSFAPIYRVKKAERTNIQKKYKLPSSPRDEELWLVRTNDAISKIRQRADGIIRKANKELGKEGKPYFIKSPDIFVEEDIEENIAKYVSKNPNLKAARDEAIKIYADVVESIKSQNKGRGMTLIDLNDYKRTLQNASNYSTVSDNPAISELYKDIARDIRIFIESAVSMTTKNGDKLHRINSTSQKMQAARNMLVNRVSTLKSDNGPTLLRAIGLSPSYGIARGAEEASKGAIGGKIRAGLSDIGSALESNKFTKHPTGLASEALTTGPSRYILRPEDDQAQTRQPQSIDEEIEVTGLPRNSDEAWSMPEFLVEKTRDDPAMNEGFKRAIYNNDKKMFDTMFEVYSQMNNHKMQFDKYNSINGKVVHPQEIQAVIKDLSNMYIDDPVIRVLKINKFNKTGELPEELR